MTLKKLRELKNLAEEEILSLPVSARVRRTNQFNWESFMNETFHPCVAAFIEEIKEAFEQLQFRVNFTIFDPRKLLKAKEELKMCGNKELSEFLSHYPVSKAAVFKANRTSPAADFDFDKAKSEWSGFKDLMFQKHENYYYLIDSKIAAVQSPGNRGKTSVTNFKKERTMSSAKLFWESFSTDNPMRQLYPKLFFLFYMLNIFPLINIFTFFEVEVDKNESEKPTISSKARSASRNWHRVTERWL